MKFKWGNKTVGRHTCSKGWEEKTVKSEAKLGNSGDLASKLKPKRFGGAAQW